ncbi:MAG: DNA polymerase III subunit beta [Candidatus Dormibacteraceae bacterium]
MRLTCRPGVLSQALQTVSRAISTRTTLPILNNILLETTPEGLALTATNLEIGIRKLVPAEISSEGSTTAPARLFTDFVSTLPDADLTLDLDVSTQTLNLRCERFDTHFKCIEADEFPPGPKPDEGDRLVIPMDDILRAVEQTQMAASTDEARPPLTRSVAWDLAPADDAAPPCATAAAGNAVHGHLPAVRCEAGCRPASGDSRVPRPLPTPAGDHPNRGWRPRQDGKGVGLGTCLVALN